MFSAFITTFSHTLNYIIENLSCLSYGFEIFLHKYLINFACYDLLVDIAESFGIWVVLFVLVAAALLVSVTIHQYTNVTKTAPSSTSQTSKPYTYKSFLKFLTLSKTKL